MALVTITPKAVTIQGYQILAPPDMLAALQYISGLTAAVYSGTVNCQNTGGTVTWQLLINNQTNNTSQVAKLNDWIILENNAIVTVCPAANYATLYN